MDHTPSNTDGRFWPMLEQLSRERCLEWHREMKKLVKLKAPLAEPLALDADLAMLMFAAAMAAERGACTPQHRALANSQPTLIGGDFVSMIMKHRETAPDGDVDIPSSWVGAYFWHTPYYHPPNVLMSTDDTTGEELIDVGLVIRDDGCMLSIALPHFRTNGAAHWDRGISLATMRPRDRNACVMALTALWQLGEAGLWEKRTTPCLPGTSRNPRRGVVRVVRPPWQRRGHKSTAAEREASSLTAHLRRGHFVWQPVGPRGGPDRRYMWRNGCIVNADGADPRPSRPIVRRPRVDFPIFRPTEPPRDAAEPQTAESSGAAKWWQKLLPRRGVA